MTEAGAGTLKQTPLHARRRSLGARLVPVGGSETPVAYSGISDALAAVQWEVSQSRHTELRSIPGREAGPHRRHEHTGNVA